MKFVKLTAAEYEDFQSKSPCRNCLNSIEAIKLQKKQNWFDVELVGVKNEAGEVIAAAPIAFRPAVKISKYCLSQRGLLVDYNDKKLLEFFVRELQGYLRKKGAMYLQISPIVEWRKLNLQGEVIKGTQNDTPVDNLREVGFLRRPNAADLDFDIEVPREYFVRLTRENGEFYTEEELLKNFNTSVKRGVARSEKYGVKVRELKKSELSVFREIVMETAERRNFVELVRNLKHYEDEFDAYGEHIKFYLAYVDCEEFLKTLEVERAKLEADKERLNARLKAAEDEAKREKIKTQIRIADEGLTAVKKREEKGRELKEKYGKTANLATAMFLDFPNESVYLTSGSREGLKDFGGPLAIQWYTIKKCLKEKVPIYNFYGISGDFTSASDEAGVLDYKAHFRGEIKEKIGDFYLPVNKPLYRLYRLIKRRKY